MKFLYTPLLTFILHIQIAINASSPGIAARTLACIADTLGCFAGGKGGLRSGPGRNSRFLPAFDNLEDKRYAQGIAEMAVYVFMRLSFVMVNFGVITYLQEMFKLNLFSFAYKFMVRLKTPTPYPN